MEKHVTRIKVNDLPKDMTVSEDELKVITAGFNPQPEPPKIFQPWSITYKPIRFR